LRQRVALSVMVRQLCEQFQGNCAISENGWLHECLRMVRCVPGGLEDGVNVVYFPLLKIFPWKCYASVTALAYGIRVCACLRDPLAADPLPHRAGRLLAVGPTRLRSKRQPAQREQYWLEQDSA